MFMEINTCLYESNNPWFKVNESKGNIHLPDGVFIHDDETYVFNIDCTKGVNAAVLTVTRSML